jgi:hypothetical protein
MSDRELLLDLRCPRRAVVFYLATGVPLVGLILTFFIAGWNDTRDQTVLLIILGIGFALPGIQGIQERVQLSRTSLRKRYLGIWRSWMLPSVLHFERKPDLNGQVLLARRWLASPPSIAILDGTTRRYVGEIGFDMLAGMSDAEYEVLMKHLRAAVQQRG